jgi:hypothetical protein
LLILRQGIIIFPCKFIENPEKITGWSVVLVFVSNLTHFVVLLGLIAYI